MSQDGIPERDGADVMPEQPNLYASLESVRANPKKRKRTKNNDDIGRDAAAEEDENLRKVDRLTRFDALLFCSPFRYHAIIQEAFGDDVDPDSYEYLKAYNMVHDHVKYYKSQTLKKVEEHVDKVLEENESWKRLRNRQQLAQKFKGVYSQETFAACWYWIAPYIDMEKSSELAKYFFETIYINLAVEMKFYLDAVAAETEVADTRARLLDFYDRLPLAQDLREMTKAELHELTCHGKGRKSKAKKKKKSDALDRFQSIGLPPPPRTAQNAVPQAVQPSPSVGKPPPPPPPPPQDPPQDNAIATFSRAPSPRNRSLSRKRDQRAALVVFEDPEAQPPVNEHQGLSAMEDLGQGQGLRQPLQAASGNQQRGSQDGRQQRRKQAAVVEMTIIHARFEWEGM